MSDLPNCQGGGGYVTIANPPKLTVVLAVTESPLELVLVRKTRYALYVLFGDSITDAILPWMESQYNLLSIQTSGNLHKWKRNMCSVTLYSNIYRGDGTKDTLIQVRVPIPSSFAPNI